MAYRQWATALRDTEAKWHKGGVQYSGRRWSSGHIKKLSSFNFFVEIRVNPIKYIYLVSPFLGKVHSECWRWWDAKGYTWTPCNQSGPVNRRALITFLIKLFTSFIQLSSSLLAWWKGNVEWITKQFKVFFPFQRHMGEEMHYQHPFDGHKSILIGGKTDSSTAGELQEFRSPWRAGV